MPSLYRLPTLDRRAQLEEGQNEIIQSSRPWSSDWNVCKDGGLNDLNLSRYREWKGRKKEMRLSGRDVCLIRCCGCLLCVYDPCLLLEDKWGENMITGNRQRWGDGFRSERLVPEHHSVTALRIKPKRLVMLVNHLSLFLSKGKLTLKRILSMTVGENLREIKHI